MGFKIKKELIANSGFRPIDLNERNVHKIFEECLATKNSKKYIKSVLQPASWGNDKDSDPIIFDSEKLRANINNVIYLYGQLRAIHIDINTINTSRKSYCNSMLNYKNVLWTTNKGILMQFFHLGVATNIIYPFGKEENSGFRYAVPPTLSPNDPNFPEWWAKHKSEWEEGK
ncbi:MAG: hypothetical protein LUH48_02980 [Clostridiales bacterium]|nr:hypothetical protein [Clostridiales bacterium]